VEHAIDVTSILVGWIAMNVIIDFNTQPKGRYLTLKPIRVVESSAFLVQSRY